ncbi:MAG: hypothetical protein DBY37_00645 [Desulfovibrionaceae bacterium]|nr:MAG: hypothetical protein DBY37_13980 [Desulfovibrionaceae bacterium]PWL65511.1 MAG: hypothetical protein DBY37_00645 [Desulfovibrionaceae bacterium]
MTTPLVPGNGRDGGSSAVPHHPGIPSINLNFTQMEDAFRPEAQTKLRRGEARNAAPMPRR